MSFESGRSDGVSVGSGLSLRLLLLTIVFVMISEVAIYVPSIARFRQVFLEDRIADAHLATLVLHGGTDSVLAKDLETSLLGHAGLIGIELWRPPRAYLLLGENPGVDASVDLRDETPWTLIRGAFVTLYHRGGRLLRVIGPAPMDPTLMVEVYFGETGLYEEMVDYSQRILALSAIISLITAALVYLSLQLIMVRGLRRVTRNLMEFRQSPEDPGRAIVVGGRRDEIGLLEKELAHMQQEVRQSLARKTRLAALGTAVSKINHDLKSVLTTVSLASERLARADDLGVARVAQLLVKSVERAAHLCTQTLDLARGDQTVPERSNVNLTDLIAEVAESLRIGIDGEVNLSADCEPELEVKGDRDRLYRVFLNLGRNALQAVPRGGSVHFEAKRLDGKLQVLVSDDGPGIPEAVLARLFEPFSGSGRGGGTGLGLPTARDLVRGHGGSLELVRTGSDGTCFAVELPDSFNDSPHR